MSICIIDTSVFCEILAIPGKAGRVGEVRDGLAERVRLHETLLLPMTTVIETGNHIGHCGDGSVRRAAAVRFRDAVEQALAGETPFVPTPMIDMPRLRQWLARFPDWAKQTGPDGKGSGLGDLTIVAEWEHARLRNPGRRVYIWSLDARLAGYDTESRARSSREA
jgi:hypothetical protein